MCVNRTRAATHNPRGGLVNSLLLDSSGLFSTVFTRPGDSAGYLEQEYYKSGTVSRECEILNGISECREFYISGNPKSHFQILNLSSYNVGYYIEWYDNGNLKYKFNYDLETPNLKNGFWDYFDENGNLYKREEYVDGALINTTQSELKVLNNPR